MRLLVTGGAGFIGSNFILYWLKKYPKDYIVNLDKLTYAGNLENLRNVENNQNYRFIKGDICDLQVVDSLMKDIDIVVHFAAESHVDRSIADASPFMTTNVIGTYILLDSAVKNKIKRFHHISTDEVFGSLPRKSIEKFNENTKYNPRSPYAASKASSDHLARAYYVTYGLPVTISNCSNNFGPYQFPEKLIPLAITNILQGHRVPIYGDGLYIRDWLYVEDHVAALDMIVNKGRIGETYFVGGAEEEINNISLIKKIINLMGKNENLIEYVADRPGHDRRYAIDSTKLRKEFGWKQNFDLDKALNKTINWYKDNTKWWQDIKKKQN